MADYIYLLQNRLTPGQWRVLEAVRETARAHGMPVFLVGGSVRDLTTGSPVRDLDFAVQGDARSLTQDLEAKGATLAGENAVLGSTYLTFQGGVRAEVAPTLSVSYPKPGQPEVQSATILDDLRRRDFTANAMAVSLNEGSYGLLLDPLNGTADIENHELRLVSPYGFIEQPALLIRAARLGERLGWSLEERTQSRYNTSKEEGHIEALPAADRAYELEETFHEEDPLAALEHLTAEGWRDVLFPALRASDGDPGAMDDVRDLVGQLEGQGLHPNPSAVFFPLVTAKMSEQNRTALKAMFVRQGFVRQIETLEARAKELASQLTSKTATQPSAIWHVLTGADPEVVLYLAYHSRSGAVQSKIKAFLKEWPQARQKIPYALMAEMRITPDLPQYSKLLDDLFFALIDGKLETTEATRAFLEPFSPPAPPQINVRRRPAKATRGRAKKALEEVEEVEEEAVDLEEDDAAEEGSEDDEEQDSRSTPADDDDDDDEEAEEDEDAKPRKATSSVKKAKSVEITGAKSAVSAKTGTDPKPAAQPTPVVVPAKAVAEDGASATAEARGKGKAAAKTAEPEASSPQKAAVKGVPVSKVVIAKAPVKAAATAPSAAKSAAKATKPAATQVITVKQPPPSKSATKKQAEPVRAVSPKKAASKAPVKGKSAR